MYVCLCFGVNERAIRQLIEDGARSIEAVGAACRAGTECGSCRQKILHLLDEKRAGDSDASRS
ncbi:MAG: (2Fe-2S)-binding protein [Acidobacteria bacterium]|nr:(2Fe-2S)-binding protein [Acidobacteriota bacterium]